MSSTTPTFTEACPVYSPFFSAMGAASAIVFACFGAAYGTAKAAGGIVSTAVMRPEAIFKLILPIIMAGVIGIYGLVVAVLVSNKVEAVMSLRDSFMHLASGLSVGLSGLVAGFSIGIVGDAGSRALAQQPRLFIGTMLILVFAEVLGLYGLIIGVIFAAKEASPC